MTGSQKKLSVSEAANLCKVGRTTVGYWIRSKKLHATRVGRNYTIAVVDLLYFLSVSGQQIPACLMEHNCRVPYFKSFQHCWQYWKGSEHGSRCHDCIAFKKQIETCFTVKDSELLACSDCSTCRYYSDTYLARIQFVHQINLPAAVFKDLYLWGGNSLCAEICRVRPKDLVGLGIEKIVHAASLPQVIEGIRKLAMNEVEITQTCSIGLKNGREGQTGIRISVYPLLEPARAYLVLGVPLDRNK